MITTPTAGSGYQYGTRCPPHTGLRTASPLPILVVLSLLLHAMLIALWPGADMTVTEALPAGPIAVRLQNEGAGGARASTSPPAARKVSAERAPSRQPAAAASAARGVSQTVDKQSNAPQSSPRRRIGQPPTAAPPAAPTAPSATAEHNPRTDVASTRTATATGADDGAGLRAQVRGRLQHALVAHFNYPLIARRRGWEGVVRVGLRVEPDGQLSGLRVIDSSGHALLDRAALDSLHQVGRLPDVMDWMQGRRLDMVLPVRYRLIDS